MELVNHFQKSKKYEKYPETFQQIKKKPRKPKKKFKLQINDKKDAEKALQSNIPILIVESEDTAILKYPMTIPKTIITPREYVDAIETSFDIHSLQSTLPFQENNGLTPKLEDTVTYILYLDPIAARAMVKRSEQNLDLKYLQKRIYQENLEEPATKARLQDFINLPEKGKPLEKEKLKEITRKNTVKEVLP